MADELKKEVSENETEKETKKEDKPKAKKTKWLTFILYPDNTYHMQYLDWLKTHEVGFYILHEADDEGDLSDDRCTKPHYHVATYRDVQRTACSFVKNMPKVDYAVTKRDENGKPLLLSSIILSDTPKSDIITTHLVSSAQTVNDIYALAHYFIHDTFKCDYYHKKKYEKSEVQMLNNQRKIYDDCFKEENTCSSSDYLLKVLEICEDATTKIDCIAALASYGDEKLSRWFIKNSNFVLNWIWYGSEGKDRTKHSNNGKEDYYA